MHPFKVILAIRYVLNIPLLAILIPIIWIVEVIVRRKEKQQWAAIFKRDYS